MKRSFTLLAGFLFLFSTGCGSLQNEAVTATTVQYTLHDGNECDLTQDTIDEMLSESYPWRRAYAEFLWDREQLNADLERQFKSLTSDNYE